MIPQERVTRGRVKFKGVPGSIVVAVKNIDAAVPKVNEIIRRLNNSRANFPKMGILTGNAHEDCKYDYLAMEAFTSAKYAENGEFEPRKIEFIGNASANEFFSSCDLSEKAQREYFVKCIQQAAEIAKVGLGLRAVDIPAIGGMSFSTKKSIEVFNGITLRDGSRQVFVQDVESLQLKQNKRQAWAASKDAIFTCLPESQKQAALRIITQIGRREKLQ